MSSAGGARAERLPDGPVQRTALFGRSSGTGGPAGAGTSSSFGGGPGGGGGGAQALEEDNNRMQAELELKVAAIKQATIAIHDEVSEQNRMLGTMGNDFDRTGSLMTSAMGRLDGLLRGGGRTNHMFYLVLFVVGLFLLIWRFLR